MYMLRRFLVKFSVSVCLLGLIFLIFPFDLTIFSVNDRGLVVVLLSTVPAFFVLSFLKWIISGIMVDVFEFNPEFIYVVNEIMDWMRIGASFAVGAIVAPSLVPIAVLPALVSWGLMGLVSGIADVVAMRLGLGDKGRVAV